MTIGAILEALKSGKSLADIAKELEIGKEKLSKALREASYAFTRKAGWAFIGTGQEPLNTAYTEFIVQSRGVEKISNLPIKETKKESIKTSIKEIKKESNNVARKRATFDIEVALLKDLKIQAVIHDKNVYEIVENAIRKELTRMKN